MLAITLGDPGGIGYEVFLKSITLVRKEDVVIGSYNALKYYSDMLRIDIPQHLNFLDITGNFEKKDTSSLNGLIAYNSLIKGIELAKGKFVKGIVTGPVSKKNLFLAGYNFQGQTEIIAQSCGIEDYGMLMLGKINFFLLTTHIPLKDIAKFITEEYIMRKTKILNRFFVDRLKIKHPKIIFLGLNPHSGEDGLIGDEEKRILNPVISKLKEEGINVYGPIPADTFFFKKDADVFVAMYHDQGMIPFKILSFNKGVNTTIGIPFIRTSPAHGTGFDIVGKGTASGKSMRFAIRIARKLCSY